MNLDHEYWVKKFLYPFSLDPAPMKMDQIMPVGATLGHLIGNSSDMQKSQARTTGDFDVLDTSRFQFPLSHFDQKTEYYEDIINPITV